MKPVILGAAIALISAAVIGVISRPPSMMGGAAMPRSITVSGHANRKLVPDEAHLRVNLNSMKLKMAEAKSSHDEKLKDLLELTKAEGVEERKVRTESSTVQPMYEYVNEPATSIAPYPQPKQVFRGYRVQTLLDITVVDTTKVGALMEKITEAGFEKDAKTEWGNLLDLQYQVSEPDKKRDELLAEAITAARTKAERMAKAAGTVVAGVQQISEGNISPYNPPPMPMVAMKAMAMDAAGAERAPVAPPSGEQELEANVSVIFELK
ncbi:MAG: SIMPL domain-containing protein [Rickettsiales bacterium]